MMIIGKTAFIALVLITSVLFASNVVSADYINSAKQYLEKNEYKSAIIQLKNQLKNDPKDVQARYLLGITYLKTGKINSAEKELKKAYELDAGSIEIALSYAELLLIKKDYEKVNEILSIELADQKLESQRQIYLANASLGLGQIADAKQILKNLIDNNENIQAYNSLAEIALWEKESDVASQWIEKTLAVEADNKNALQLKAKLENSVGRYSDALEIYDLLIQQYPNELNLYIDRAVTNLSFNKYEDVKKDVNYILKKNKNHLMANYLFARINLQEGDFKKAKIAAQNVLNFKPNHYPSMLILGVSNVGLGEINQAEKYFLQYISEYPENLYVQTMLADLYINQKKGEQALLILESIKKDKVEGNSIVLLSMGMAYLLVGDNVKAINVLNKAQELSPDNILINKSLITGYLKSGDFPNALQKLEDFTDIYNDNKKGHYLLIISYVQQKEFEKAINKINEFLQNSPDDINLYNFQAAIQIIQGNKEAAIKSYNKALKINDKFIPAYMGLAKLSITEKQFNQADEYYKKILTINNKYITGYIGRAGVAELNGDRKNVEIFLLEGLDKVKGNFEEEYRLSALLSKFYAKNNQKLKLLKLGKTLASKYPDKLKAQSFYINNLLLNGRKKEAEDELLKIIFKNPKNVKHRILLAGLYVDKGDVQSALELLDDILSFQPDNQKVLALKAITLINDNQYKRAFEISKVFRQLYPETAISERLEGEIYLKQKIFEKALNSYQQAYNKSLNNKDLSKTINLMLILDKKEEVIILLNDMVSKDNANVFAHVKLGDIYQQQGKNKLAVKHYMIVSQYKPENSSALNNIAWIYAIQDNPEALSFAQRAYKINPGSASIVDTYGYVLIKNGMLEKGLNILENAVLLAPDDKDIQYHLAEAYYLNGKHQEAKIILQTILKPDVYFKNKSRTVELLEKLQ